MYLVALLLTKVSKQLEIKSMGREIIFVTRVDKNIIWINENDSTMEII